jgi:predicted solute-binding protein
MTDPPRVLRFGHGPDAEHACMFYGFHAGLGAVEGCTVEHAHEDEAIRHALKFGRGLDPGMGKRFVRMYVNDLTLDMGETGQRTPARLDERPQDSGAIERAPQIEVY